MWLVVMCIIKRHKYKSSDMYLLWCYRVVNLWIKCILGTPKVVWQSDSLFISRLCLFFLNKNLMFKLTIKIRSLIANPYDLVVIHCNSTSTINQTLITCWSIVCAVYIGHKEVAVYQDDLCKPPQGEGLNKRAIITLENTWPLDKTKREPIKVSIHWSTCFM